MKSVVTMSPKYKTIALRKFDGESDKREKFYALMNATHYTLPDGRYSNYFFPASANYHSRFHTAAEINEMYGMNKEEGDKNYNFTSSVLRSYCKKGLMVCHTFTTPHTYSLPVDMFQTNDVSIKFQE